jgi:dCMP deaminase
MRPSFIEIYLNFAKSIAERSTCSRLKVGCVITSTDFRYVYGIGYNGNVTGMNNYCDSQEVGSCGCLHAEENAIINCTVSRDISKYVFCTHSSCKMCAKRLINMGGVKKLFYMEEYRIRDGLDLLLKADVELIKV